jgi:hypothetical protein
MAKEYYFIPSTYEGLLTSAIDTFTADPTSWIILTGVYKPSETLDTSDSTAYSVDRVSKAKTYIKKGTLDMFGNKKALIGFSLEGDLDTLAPEYEAVIVGLDGVYETTDSEDYITYINSL